MFEQIEERSLLASVAVADSLAEPTDSAMAQFRLDATDERGSLLSSVASDEEFFIRVYVNDLRDDPQGVFSAFLDLRYDPTLVKAAGGAVFSEYYPNGLLYDDSTPGVLTEVGGFTSSVQPLGAGDFLVATVPFRAIRPGPLTFFAEAADRLPQSNVSLFGGAQPLDINSIDFGSVTLDVAQRATDLLTLVTISVPNSIAATRETFPSHSGLGVPLRELRDVREGQPFSGQSSSIEKELGQRTLRSLALDREVALITISHLFDNLDGNTEAPARAEQGATFSWKDPEWIDIGVRVTPSILLPRRADLWFLESYKHADETAEPFHRRVRLLERTVYLEDHWLRFDFLRIDSAVELECDDESDASLNTELLDVSEIAYRLGHQWVQPSVDSAPATGTESETIAGALGMAVRFDVGSKEQIGHRYESTQSPNVLPSEQKPCKAQPSESSSTGSEDTPAA